MVCHYFWCRDFTARDSPVPPDRLCLSFARSRYGTVGLVRPYGGDARGMRMEARSTVGAPIGTLIITRPRTALPYGLRLCRLLRHASPVFIQRHTRAPRALCGDSDLTATGSSEQARQVPRHSPDTGTGDSSESRDTTAPPSFSSVCISRRPWPVASQYISRRPWRCACQSQRGRRWPPG